MNTFHRAYSGSTLWLLVHELRLVFRGMQMSKGRAGIAAIVVLSTVVVLFHITGFVIAPMLDQFRDEFHIQAMVVGAISLFSLLMLFLSKSVSQAVDAFHDRGDMELLLSSPIPMRRVLATRLLSIAAFSAAMPILIILPIVNGMVLHGYLLGAGAWPTFAGMAMVSSAFGSFVAFGLLAWLGARKASVAARGMALAFGMLSLLASQAKFVLPSLSYNNAWSAMQSGADAGGNELIWWPVRALLGEVWPMVAVLMAGITALLLTSTALGRAYAQGVGHTVIAPVKRNTLVSRAWDVRGQFVSLLCKECVLLARYPGMIGSLLYQSVLLIPSLFMAQQVGEATQNNPRVAVVLLTVMMTGRIARIIVAAPFRSDEAAGLTASAPVSQRKVLLAKVLACAALLMIILSVSLLVVWAVLPSALLAATVTSVLAATCRLWLASSQKPSLRRVGMEGRVSTDKTTLPGLMSDLGWGMAGSVMALFL